LPFGGHSLNEAFEWAKKDSARVADSLKRVLTDKKIFKETLTDSLMSIDAKNLKGKDPSPGYYIICGTFTNSDNAKLTARNYSQKGYKTTIISATKRDGTRVKHVSVKTFSDRDTANLFLREFREKYDKGAWIYSRK